MIHFSISSDRLDVVGQWPIRLLLLNLQLQGRVILVEAGQSEWDAATNGRKLTLEERRLLRIRMQTASFPLVTFRDRIEHFAEKQCLIRGRTDSESYENQTDRLL